MTTRMYKTTVLVLVAAVLAVVVAWRLQSKPTEATPPPLTEAQDTAAPSSARSSATSEPDAQPAPGIASGHTSAAKPAPASSASASTRTPEYPAVIDLGMGKCIPCKQMKPILEELMQEYKGRARIEIIDIGQHPDQAEKYKVMLIPTQIFFAKGGNEVYRHEGFMPQADIVAKLNEMGVR